MIWPFNRKKKKQRLGTPQVSERYSGVPDWFYTTSFTTGTDYSHSDSSSTKYDGGGSFGGGGSSGSWDSGSSSGGDFGGGSFD